MSTRTSLGVLHRTSRRLGSIQQRFIQFQAVRDHLLCLRTKDAERPAYVNVLEVNGLSYDLKSEEEQRQLNTLNQHFLASLDFDLQVLWCVLPLHAEPYLASFVWPAEHPIPAEEDDTDDRAAVRSSLVNRDACAELAAAHVSAMEAFGQTGKTLLTRKIYLISRVEPEMAPPRRFFLTLRKRSSQTSSIHEALERARQLLDARAEHLERLLSSMGLSARRLSGHELIRFAATCLQPYQAMQASLPTEILEGLERPVVLREEGDTKTAQQAPFSLAANAGGMTPPTAHRRRRRKSVAAVESAPADLGNLTDLLAPEAITLSPDHLCIDDEWVRVLAVHRLPRVVSTGWLRPLATLDEPLMVSYHLHPLPTSEVLPRLQRRYTDHLASQLAARRKGNEVDPHVRLAASDLEPLIAQLASGEERMLQVSMHVLIRGRNRHELDTRTERVREVLRGMLVQSRVPRFEQDLALLSCLPYAHNRLDAGLLLSSRSASSMFLFLSHQQFHPSGVLEGVTPQGDPIAVDPWDGALMNANRLILGPPGWGKSHYVKTVVSRMALKCIGEERRCAAHRSLQPGAPQGGQFIVIDPEQEWTRHAQAHGGQMIRLAPGSTHHLNPFDLPRLPERDDPWVPLMEHGDRLADHVQRLHTLFDLMLANRSDRGTGRLSPEEKGLLDRALYETYRKVGISSDPITHRRQAPLMRDLYEVLKSEICGKDPTGLADRLYRYVSGSLAGLFSEPTNVALDRTIIVFDLHDLESELRPVGLFLVSHFVWTTAFQSRIPRLLIVDEAATIMTFESGATFLEDLVRRARKYYLGVFVISQHPEIFRDSAIPANCETHVLFHQDVTALDLIGQLFRLSSREQQLVQRLPVGEALVLTSTKRLHVRFLANPLEHLLATTSPRELASWQGDPQYEAVRATLWRLLTSEETPFQGGVSEEKRRVAISGEEERR